VCEGKLLFSWPISAGESFEVTFTHSVNQSPVTDFIEWTGSELIVRKSRFKAFGAGIPVPGDGIGKELVRVGDAYELIGIDKPLPDLVIMTQTVPDHRITLGTREARLLALAGSGRQVKLAVKEVPLFKLIN
jgi:hypothetical protein